MNDITFIKPFPSQYDLRGENLTCYGSDFRGCINYEFNNQGYRSSYDFNITDPDSLLVCMGSSIATGHGLPLDQSFGYLVASKFGKKLWNMGQGCYRSNNETILEQVDFLVNTNLNISYFIIQFTHLNRMGHRNNSYLELDKDLAAKNFLYVLKQISLLLKNKKWCWLLCDYSKAVLPDYAVNHPNKIVIDPESVDFITATNYLHLAPTAQSLKALTSHPGQMWHQKIANDILEYFYGH